MPLTKKGDKIMRAMKAHYGPKKGERVFYASKNKGKLKGVDSMKKGSVDAEVMSDEEALELLIRFLKANELDEIERSLQAGTLGSYQGGSGLYGGLWGQLSPEQQRQASTQIEADPADNGAIVGVAPGPPSCKLSTSWQG